MKPSLLPFKHPPQQCHTLTPPPFFFLSSHILAFLKLLPFQLTVSMPLSRQTQVTGFNRRLLEAEDGWQPLHKPIQAVLLLVPPRSALAVSCMNMVLLCLPSCPLLPSPRACPSPPSYFPTFDSRCIFLTQKLVQMPHFGACDGVGSSESNKIPLQNKSSSSVPNEELNCI